MQADPATKKAKTKKQILSERTLAIVTLKAQVAAVEARMVIAANTARGLGAQPAPVEGQGELPGLKAQLYMLEKEQAEYVALRLQSIEFCTQMMQLKSDESEMLEAINHIEGMFTANNVPTDKADSIYMSVVSLVAEMVAEVLTREEVNGVITTAQQARTFLCAIYYHDDYPNATFMDPCVEKATQRFAPRKRPQETQDGNDKKPEKPTEEAALCPFAGHEHEYVKGVFIDHKPYYVLMKGLQIVKKRAAENLSEDQLTKLGEDKAPSELSALGTATASAECWREEYQKAMLTWHMRTGWTPRQMEHHKRAVEYAYAVLRLLELTKVDEELWGMMIQAQINLLDAIGSGTKEEHETVAKAHKLFEGNKKKVNFPVLIGTLLELRKTTTQNQAARGRGGAGGAGNGGGGGGGRGGGGGGGYRGRGGADRGGRGGRGGHRGGNGGGDRIPPGYKLYTMANGQKGIKEE